MPKHVIPTQDIERFANEQRLDGEARTFEEQLREELSAPEEHTLEPLRSFQDLLPYLERIPPVEADFLTLTHLHHMTQMQVAKLFHITQAAVSYRLGRGIRRIQFLRTVPMLDRVQMAMDLDFLEPIDREILWGLYETTCQTAVGMRLSITQGRVRHRFLNVMSELQRRIADFRHQGRSLRESIYAPYYIFFSAIADRRWCILWEVALPQFARPEWEIISS